MYKNLVDTDGSCVGANTKRPPVTSEDDGRIHIVMAGDSAGGNYVCGVTSKIIQHNQEFKRTHPELFDATGTLIDAENKRHLIMKPAGLLIAYGALSVDMVWDYDVRWSSY